MVNQNNGKTTCPKGHTYSGINSQGRRVCKICINERMRLRYANPEQKQYQLNWQRENKDKVNQSSKKWRENNPRYSKDWNLKNPERRKAIDKKFRQTEKRRNYMQIIQLKYYHSNPEKYRAMQKLYRDEHPRSGAGYSLEEQLAMDQRRLMTNNICEWGGCGLKHKELGIEVNHIFPRSKYPELRTNVKNLICYCIWHHYLWHEFKGDYWAQMILQRLPNRFNYEE